MKSISRIILGLSLIALAEASHAAPPAHVWSQRFGGDDTDQAITVTVDGSGSVIISGYFSGTANFGGADLVSAGSGDIFLARYDASGTHLWSKSFGGTGFDRTIVLATDASNNIVMTGHFGFTVDFGGGPLVSAGSNDIFLAKYDASGSHVWSRRFGSTSQDNGWDVGLDGSGNVIAIGWFTGTVDFGGGNLTSAGTFDFFLAKFDVNGVHQWSRRFGGTGNDQGISARFDASGNVVMTGQFNGTVDFGGGALVSAGSTDVVVAKYDTGGAHQWSRHFGGTSNENPGSIAVDGSGNVVIVGGFNETADFGGSPLVSAGSTDIFVARYDAGGAHQWSKRFGGSSVDVAHTVVMDGAGNPALTGGFEGEVDFGGGTLTSVGGYDWGGQDVYMAKLDVSGAHLWSQAFGDSATEVGNSIALGAGGDVLLAGYFDRYVDFGGGQLAADTSADAFVAKFKEQGPLPVLISRFDATLRAGGVDLVWDFSSDEPLGAFVLYRAQRQSSPVVIATGDARTTRSHADKAVTHGETYRYELVIQTADGDEFRSPVATATIPRAVTTLAQNFPNPFNPETTIEYTVGARASIAIEIFDASGALVKRLEEGVREPGGYRAQWNGRDAANRSVGSGVYFYRLAGVKGTETRKMVLLK